MPRFDFVTNFTTQASAPIIKLLLRVSPAIAFAIGAALTISVAVADKRLIQEQGTSLLEHQALFAEIEFRDRIAMYRYLLGTGEGLMAHDLNMTPMEWHAFINKINLGASYPGIISFSVIRYLSHMEKDAFSEQQAIRTPGFEISPSGIRPDYLVLTRNEGLNGTPNIIGFDVGTDPIRRQTMMLARDSADATLTAPVPLLGDRQRQSGALSYSYYSPLYKGALTPSSITDRRKNLIGWVSVDFSIDGLLSDILRKYPFLDIEVHDIDSDGREIVIFDSDNSVENSSRKGVEPAFKHTSIVSVGSRQWKLTIGSTPELEREMVSHAPLKILVGGLFAALLLGAVVELLLRGRQHAYKLAQSMTTAHRESEQRYRGLISAQNDMVIRLRTDRRLTFVNDNVTSILGKPHHEIVGTDWAGYFDSEDIPATVHAIAEIVNGDQSRFLINSRIMTTQGLRWYAWDGCGIPDDVGGIAEIQATGRDITNLMLHEAQLRSTLDIAEHANMKLLKSNIQILTILSKIIALRDSDTFHHNLRVMNFSHALAQDMGLNNDDIRNLIKGALLHDIGKIGISDTILLKPGKLTDEEFVIMKSHVTIGRDFVRDAVWLDDGVDVILYHHEKFNGTGYCTGLQGDDIPLLARIFAVCDVFDALTSARPYKKPFSYDQAMAIMVRDSGSHFDPAIMDRFTVMARDLYDRFGDRNDQSVEVHSLAILEQYFSAQPSHADGLVPHAATSATPESRTDKASTSPH